MIDQNQQVLDCPMQPNDSGANTVRGYLRALLVTLWEEEEGFSGKRPFGNSGWQSDVYEALVRAELIDGHIDRYDGVEELGSCDDARGEALVLDAIGSLFE